MDRTGMHPAGGDRAPPSRTAHLARLRAICSQPDAKLAARVRAPTFERAAAPQPARAGPGCERAPVDRRSNAHRVLCVRDERGSELTGGVQTKTPELAGRSHATRVRDAGRDMRPVVCRAHAKRRGDVRLSRWCNLV